MFTPCFLGERGFVTSKKDKIVRNHLLGGGQSRKDSTGVDVRLGFVKMSCLPGGPGRKELM